MTNLNRSLLFILLTPLFCILGIWISVFPHEYAHSITAWLFGFKANPFGIYYGHFNWQNVLFVTGIDENNNYYLMYLLGAPIALGWAAFAGPLTTLIFYLFTLGLLNSQKLNRHPYWFYFIFWVNLLNLSELVSYIILRSFSAHGDIGHVEFGWGISPWLIFLGGGSLTLIGLWYFFTRTLTDLYARMKLNTALSVFILTLSTFFIFGEGGIRMFLESYGAFATDLGILFMVLMPVVILVCWPSRRWVNNAGSTHLQ